MHKPRKNFIEKLKKKRFESLTFNKTKKVLFRLIIWMTGMSSKGRH